MDPEVQKKVDEKLKLTKVKAAVERAQKRVTKDKDKDQDTPLSSLNNNLEKARAFMTALASNSSDYNLQDSFILDSGATVHVCNSHKRFATFTPASKDDLLYVGNTIIPIEGFGLVDVTIQTPAGLKLIELLNTALISSFHTSVVSLKRIMAKGVY